MVAFDKNHTHIAAIRPTKLRQAGQRMCIIGEEDGVVVAASTLARTSNSGCRGATGGVVRGDLIFMVDDALVVCGTHYLAANTCATTDDGCYQVEYGQIASP